MSINYYCSGFNLEEGFFPELAERLKEDIKGNKRIVFITGANKPDKIKKVENIYIPGLLNFFKNIGATFDEKHLITQSTESKEAQDLLKESDFIFLLGGDPFLQMELITSKGLANIIKNYDKVIMGMSAGGMIMGEYIIITPCSEEYPNFDIRDGLKLDRLSIYPHINTENEVPDKIDLGDEIVIKDDLFTVAKKYGNFYLLQDSPTVSLIRTEGEKIEFIGGLAFEVTPNKIVKINSKINKVLK